MKTSELMVAAMTAGLSWQQQMYFFGLVFSANVKLAFFPHPCDVFAEDMEKLLGVKGRHVFEDLMSRTS